MNVSSHHHCPFQAPLHYHDSSHYLAFTWGALKKQSMRQVDSVRHPFTSFVRNVQWNCAWWHIHLSLENLCDTFSSSRRSIIQHSPCTRALHIDSIVFCSRLYLVGILSSLKVRDWASKGPHHVLIEWRRVRQTKRVHISYTYFSSDTAERIAHLFPAFSSDPPLFSSSYSPAYPSFLIHDYICLSCKWMTELESPIIRVYKQLYTNVMGKQGSADTHITNFCFERNLFLM